MDLRDKVISVLVQALEPEYVRLENDEGLSGFVVSRRFEGMPSLDRQEKIEEALRGASLAPEERRQVIMIAGLTPAEYDAAGIRIRVHRVKEVAGGAVEVLLHGGTSDAEYVRGSLNNQKGVQTTNPKPVSGALGVLMSFRAKGTEANPLTKEKILRALKKDPYIEVMSNA
jgi:hypothetical protein